MCFGKDHLHLPGAGGGGAFLYQTKGSLFVMGRDRGQKKRERAKDEQRARMKAVAVTGDLSAEAESGQPLPDCKIVVSKMFSKCQQSHSAPTWVIFL